MKKVLLALLAAGAVCACAKTETVVDETLAPPSEITFKTVARNLTKAEAVVIGAKLTENAHVIHSSAAYHAEDANGAVFFENISFSSESEGEPWKGTPPVYWPFEKTDSLDFLAYVIADANKGGDLAGKYTAKWSWDQTVKQVQLECADIYADQRDILYAYTNNTSLSKSNNGTIPLEFHHALALLQFNAKATKGDFTITKIEIGESGEGVETGNKLKTKGTLTIAKDGDKASLLWGNTLEATEDAKTVTIKNSEGKSEFKVSTNEGFDKVGETLLIPPQDQLSFTISYTITIKEDQTTTGKITYPKPASAAWAAGKKYIYNITFNPTEITVSPTVENYDKEVTTGEGENATTTYPNREETSITFPTPDNSSDPNNSSDPSGTGD